jgi:hypothetical protein
MFIAAMETAPEADGEPKIVAAVLMTYLDFAGSVISDENIKVLLFDATGSPCSDYADVSPRVYGYYQGYDYPQIAFTGPRRFIVTWSFATWATGQPYVSTVFTRAFEIFESSVGHRLVREVL